MSEAQSVAAVAQAQAPAARAGARPTRWRALAMPAALLVLWELAARLAWIQPHLMPPPSVLAQTLQELAGGGTLLEHLGVSALRVIAGFGIGASLAVAAGAAVGLSRRLEAYVDPTFQALRAIPSLAWVPLLLLWLGIDEAPKITLIAIGAFFPVYLAVQAGIQNVDRKFVELGQVYGLKGAELVRRIFIPAALPGLFTGLRTGLGLAWMFLVAAELIAATKGLGYLLTDGRETGRADVVLVAIILLAALGKASDGLLKALEGCLLRWRDSYASTRED